MQARHTSLDHGTLLDPHCTRAAARLDKKHPGVKFDPLALYDQSELYLKSCFRVQKGHVLKSKLYGAKNSTTFQDEMIAEQRKRHQSSMLAQRRQLAQLAQIQQPATTEPSASFQYPKLEGS